MRKAPGSARTGGSFAANRAVSRIALAVAAAGGASRRSRIHEAGSLRVRFPGPPAQTLDAVIVNTGGGVAGGDRCDMAVTVEAGARLAVTTAAAEKVYRALDADAAIDVRLTVGAGGRLDWLPQETILFDRARLRRTIEVDLDERAGLVLAEAIVFGRTAMGEVVEQGSLFDRWRVRRGGKLVFAETVVLADDVAQKLAAPAVAARGAAIATLLVIPGSEIHVGALRDIPTMPACEIGVSAWNGFAVARCVARDGGALRQQLLAALPALGVPVPRLWLN